MLFLQFEFSSQKLSSVSYNEFLKMDQNKHAIYQRT
uniref:Uncharacterized protein n=1 Tax=Anguilla anguilla TaxID=7936 RepID=A0A0E9SV77_ANGAN